MGDEETDPVPTHTPQQLTLRLDDERSAVREGAAGDAERTDTTARRGDSAGSEPGPDAAGRALATAGTACTQHVQPAPVPHPRSSEVR